MSRLIMAAILMLSAFAATVQAQQKVFNDNQNKTDMESNTIRLTIEGGRTFTATLVDNSSTQALKEQLAKGNITVEMEDYASMEKVGSLGISLPRNDRPTTTGSCSVCSRSITPTKACSLAMQPFHAGA